MAPFRALALLLWLPAVQAARRQELASGAGRAVAFAGRVLAGRYELLEPLQANGSFPHGGSPLLSRFAAPKRLGSGAFGEAWKAYDLRRKEEVVVKLFKGDGHEYLTGSERAAAMEAAQECSLSRRIAKARSSYDEGRGRLCACLESHALDGAEGDLFFIVTEFCGSQSLQAKLGAASIAEVRAWTLDVMQGICFMSGLKPPVSHQDLHAGNVVVSASGRARLIDFGMAAETSGGDVDVSDWGSLYGSLLCSTRGMAMGWGQPSRCRDGTMGVGTERDWRLVDLALDGRTAPRELLEMLPSYVRKEAGWSHLARGVARLLKG